MNRFTNWLALLLIAMGMAAPAFAKGDEGARPNIILIMADDVGSECFGCYGSQQYKTPNIDEMARRGIRFTQCHSQPLCTPSRIKLMTGMSNARNYSAFSILNRDQNTIGHFFQEAGYETLVAGKWQLRGAKHYGERFRGKGTLPKDAGFDHHCLWQVDQLGGRYWSPLLTIDGEAKQFTDDDYGPDIATEYITDFIKNRTSDEPFFVYYPMIMVHSPFEPAPNSKSRDSKDAQANFEDMVSYMDELVGRIIQTTRDLKIDDNTLILFIGDNGTHKKIESAIAGRVLKGGKGNTTTAGTSVPMVALCPKSINANSKGSGKVNEDLIDFSDFLPTLLEAGNVKLAAVETEFDGTSFLPQLMGESGSPREWIYCFYCPRPEKTKPVRFVFDKRWKLYGDGRFFDIVNDPDERKSIVEIDKFQGAKEAREKLEEALASMPAEGRMLLKFSK